MSGRSPQKTTKGRALFKLRKRRNGRRQFNWYFDGRYIRGNHAKLLCTGDEVFPQLEKMIEEAQHHIHIECYIYREDEVGQRIAEALRTAAQRGVVVHVHLDALGCLGLTNRFVRSLTDAGIEVEFFHPIFRSLTKFSSLTFRRRLHRKVFVVDSNRAIVGGINIGNEYATQKGKPAWLDFGVYVEGPAAYHLNKIVEKTWRREGRSYFYFKAATQAMKPVGSVEVAVVRNFLFTGLYDIHISYMAAIKRARKEIIIANAYFLPGLYERLALKDAVRRGVRIIVIVPAISDILLMKWATRSLYRFLFQVGVEIWEWQPSMMHAKVAVVDKRWATVGSHNLDHLSRYFNLELNLNVKDERFAHALSDTLEKELNQCLRIVPADWQRSRYFWHRFLEWLAFQLVSFYSGFGGKVIRRASKRVSSSF